MSVADVSAMASGGGGGGGGPSGGGSPGDGGGPGNDIPRSAARNHPVTRDASDLNTVPTGMVLSDDICLGGKYNSCD